MQRMPPFLEKKIENVAGKKNADQPGDLGQDHGHCRDVGDQQQAQDDGCIVHEHVGHHLGQRGAANLDAHEQGVAHRGRDVADAEVVHEDQAEMDGMHPIILFEFASRCSQSRVLPRDKNNPQ